MHSLNILWSFFSPPTPAPPLRRLPRPALSFDPAFEAAPACKPALPPLAPPRTAGLDVFEAPRDLLAAVRSEVPEGVRPLLAARALPRCAASTSTVLSSALDMPNCGAQGAPAV
jgi:hypothetical protein